eukprot:scaffold162644_cov26-Prasinocladus_malaysianus.AAC.1
MNLGYWPLSLPAQSSAVGGVIAASSEDASLSFIHVEDGAPPPTASSSGTNTPISMPTTPASRGFLDSFGRRASSSLLDMDDELGIVQVRTARRLAF